MAQVQRSGGTQGHRGPPPSADSTAVRAFVIGSLIGAVLVAGFCFGAITLFGGSVGGAAAVAGYCAIFGGPGFGGTMGFVLFQSRARSDRHQ